MKYTYYTDTGLEIEYTIHEDKGDYLQPPHFEVELVAIYYDDYLVTPLMYDVAEPYLQELTEEIETLKEHTC